MTTDLPEGTTDADEGPEECRPEECHPAAGGILRCLEMLADEATALCLPRTLEALHQAMAACAVEAAEIAERNRHAALRRPAGATLH